MTPFDILLSRLASPPSDRDWMMMEPWQRAVIERLDGIHGTVRWISIVLVAGILALGAVLVNFLQ